MTTKKALLLGCAGVALVGLVSASTIGFFLYHVSQDVEGMSIAVKGPDEVTVGQSFDLEIVVRNDRSKKPLRMSDIDLADEYLEGFTVSSASPAYKSSTHVPLDNKRSFTFDVSIPSGQSRSFVFKMRARKAGLFRGDVDVCEGLQFRTEMLQTEVREKP
ncbi:MAG TPA: hypothetical protein VNM14_18395 [Planctomycetota bacterium]|jgi:hypothetical protein|nr:hypothetical protein [Planctomycetota bacterium]